LRFLGAPGAKRSAIASGAGVSAANRSAASRSLKLFGRIMVSDWLCADAPMKPSYASHNKRA
jgi:hypothetical protein